MTHLRLRTCPLWRIQKVGTSSAILQRTFSTSRSPFNAGTTPSQKEEGTIASVFATLSGGSLDDALPARFGDLKSKILTGNGMANEAQMRHHLTESWRDLLPALATEMKHIVTRKQELLPSVEYPRGGQLKEALSPQTMQEIKKRGVVVIKGVIPEDEVLQWKQDIRDYARENQARGFPEDNPQVYELYWSKAQVAARSHPALLEASQAILSLWKQSSTGDLPIDNLADMTTPLTYADRLRIQIGRAHV